MKKIKLDAIDRIFSKLVRMRDRWTCTCCHTVYPENAQGLHASHIFGRARKSTRWLPLNVVSHCMACHSRLGGNPLDFHDWTENYLGKERTDRLRELANRPVHLTTADKADILADYKAQLKDFQVGDDIETPAVLLLKLRGAGMQ